MADNKARLSTSDVPQRLGQNQGPTSKTQHHSSSSRAIVNSRSTPPATDYCASSRIFSNNSLAHVREQSPTGAMNTISPPPQIRKISAPKRVLGVVVGIAGGLGANAMLGYSFMSFYTRSTKFVPYDNTSPDHATPVFKAHNPSGNAPVCIDHAIKSIPYSKLPEKYIKAGKVDQEQLATDFCRGIWSGVAYRVQRRYLERKYRALPGREDSLWDVKELERSDYAVGTKITDHFEVVEHDDSKVYFSFPLPFGLDL
jgi:hypothetical protein